jgi:hypothetical protein
MYRIVIFIEIEKNENSLYSSSELSWENPRKIVYILNQINEIQLDVQIIVLPEMFTSGFTMNPERVTEGMDGETNWIKTLVASRVCFMGSLMITEEICF